MKFRRKPERPVMVGRQSWNFARPWKTRINLEDSNCTSKISPTFIILFIFLCSLHHLCHFYIFSLKICPSAPSNNAIISLLFESQPRNISPLKSATFLLLFISIRQISKVTRSPGSSGRCAGAKVFGHPMQLVS